MLVVSVCNFSLKVKVWGICLWSLAHYPLPFSLLFEGGGLWYLKPLSLIKFCSVIFFFRCDDYLKLFLYLERPEVNENSKDDVVLCGNMSNLQQKTFYSKSRSLIMEFHTTVPHRDQLRYYKGYSGFRGLFRFKDESKSCDIHVLI